VELELTPRRIQVLLNQMEDELTSVLLDRAVGGERLSVGSSDPTTSEQRAEDSATYSALHNPLGVLASAATTHTGGMLLHGGQSGLYWNSERPQECPVANASDIYSVKPEEDLSQDPVLQGLLTEDDLNRLVELYFTKLSPVFLHLDKEVHTPIFLRMNSPFLTTAIAAIAASYDPLSLLLAPALQAHAHHLASLTFTEGSKSLEVVQGFLALVSWAVWPSDHWLADRSWAYQGQAMRLACEIRLDLPPDQSLTMTYRHSRPLYKDEIERLMACRRRTYLLVCISEIAYVQSCGPMLTYQNGDPVRSGGHCLGTSTNSSSGSYLPHAGRRNECHILCYCYPQSYLQSVTAPMARYDQRRQSRGRTGVVCARLEL
jgi:hypothetical protein